MSQKMTQNLEKSKKNGTKRCKRNKLKSNKKRLPKKIVTNRGYKKIVSIREMYQLGG